MQENKNISYGAASLMDTTTGTESTRLGINHLYFTPSIEDIRVGYECEIDWAGMAGGRENYLKQILKLNELSGMNEFFIKAAVRVPYLTKEQIEAEGWEEHANGFEKDGNLLKLLNNRDVIISHAGFSKFCGECKDINTFRYICKLLNIK